ncbi:hypothetical protein ACLB2K_025068 [Fragaria x ananassa]
MCKLITVRLDRSNYIAWFFQLETMLHGLDLMSYVDGSCSSPPLFGTSMTTAFAKEFREWSKNDKAVLSLISATICDEALSYLVGSSSSREAWLRLRNKYSAVSSSDVMQLKTDLHTLRKNAESVDIYLQRVKGIRDQLAFVGVHYTDEDIIFLALNGLPREYNNIKVVVRAMDKSISMQKFQSLLLDAERDFEKQMHENLSDNATRNFRNNGNQSSGKSKKRNNGGRKYDKSVSSDYKTGANVIPECQICRKRDHTASICYWRKRSVNISASIVRCQFFGKRGHIALDCHRMSNYTFQGPKPHFTHSVMTAHNTDGGSPSGTFTSAHSSPRYTFIGTHIGVSPAVVDGGEHIMIDNDRADFYDVVAHVKAKSDDKADSYVVVGNDKCVSTSSGEDLFGESQNELEKVVDDVKSFNSEDDQFCDGQQQLEKSEDDNGSVSTDSDEDMSDERRPQLKKLVEYSSSEYDEDLLDCSRSLWKGKCVTTNEFHRYSCKRIGHVCGDDCFDFSDDKKANENIDINDVTMEYVLLFLPAKTLCKFRSIGIRDIICNPVNKQYAVLHKIYHEPKSVLALAFEPSVLGFVENVQFVCAFSLSDQQVICFDIYSSRLSSWKCYKTECCETDAMHLTGHWIFLKGMIFWETLAGTMFESSSHLLGSSDENVIRKDDYRYGVFMSHEKYAEDLIHRAGLDTSRVCSSPCLSHVQIFENEGTILCNHIFFRFIAALVVLSNTWLMFFSRLAYAIKRTFYGTVFCSTQSFILSMVSQVLSTNLSLVTLVDIEGGC